MERDEVVKLCSEVKLLIRDLPTKQYEAHCLINELMDSDWEQRKMMGEFKEDIQCLHAQVDYLQSIGTEQVFKYRELESSYNRLSQFIGVKA